MNYTHKIAGSVLSVAMLTTAVPISQVCAGQIIYDCDTGIEDGYNYELWKDYGNTKMELTGNGTFKCEWNNINNCLFRTGKKFDCTQTYKDIGNIAFDYEVDYHPDGNSYLCVYGWTKEPLVEYYIVDSWGTWRPPGDEGEYLGEATIDGAVYDIYKTIRIDKPSIVGDTTFEQYWSIRKDKRTSGVINVASHFAAWEKLGLPAGNLYEAALNIEGYQSAGSATVLKNEMIIGGDIPDPEPATEAEPDENGYYFHSDFESGKDGWAGRGDASVSASDGILSVTGRTDSWHGASYSLNSSVFVPGNSYSFSVMAMQNQAVSEEFKLTLQYKDTDGKEHYDNIASATGEMGQWVQLANTSFEIPAGASNLILYVETASGTTSFYIDDAVGAQNGTKISVSGTSSAKKGDVTLDGSVNVSDLVAVHKYLLGMNKITLESFSNADINDDGNVNIYDLLLLKRQLLNPEKKNESVTEPQEQRIEGQWYNTADISWIDKSKPMVAIAFDDGPIAGSNCPTRIQNALSENGFHATFFYWGERIAGNEAEIKRAQELGFEIANHTWSHPDMTTLSADQMKNEITKCADALKAITGQEEYLIRPPYLKVNDTFKEIAGVPLINCGVYSMDWEGASKEDIINTITSGMNNGTLNGQVVLVHENYETTAQAMEYLAPYMKAQGWQIVTVSEMFKANNKTMYNGIVYNNIW
ncbi:MAG: glycoside hydrolase family 11 protein [Oscillospiraceae bacterium]|nr:glycoside hydrolase family 11 protein [Oscillospiraceae bacterium]